MSDLNARPRIAFIGIGLMGLPMANNLINAGFPLQVWNRTSAKAEALDGDGVSVAVSVIDALADADIIISMLESGPVVDQLLYHSQAYRRAKAGALFIDMSSIPPATARQHAQLLQASGRDHLDAPVSGGTLGAAEASLSIMVGGSRAAFERAAPVLHTLGTPHYIGPSGAGQLAKLANQAIVGITIGAVSEALLLASAGGADPVAVRAALSGGFASSRILTQHGQRMIERDFTPGARARVQLKDLDTIVASAAEYGLELPLTRNAQQLYQAMVDDGLDQLDHSALLLHLEALNGIKAP